MSNVRGESMEIEDYLNSDWVKNSPQMMSAFMDYISDEDREWYFKSGENGYCGYTAIVSDSYNPFGCPRFEFAYSKDFVKVFTANHHGFWVPEYISLTGGDASEILNILKQKLLKSGGF